MKKLTKAHLRFLARRRRKRTLLATKIKIVNMDLKNTVKIEMQVGRRE